MNVSDSAAAFRSSPRRGMLPRRSGREFAAWVADFRPPHNTVAVWYLSQESVVWKAARASGESETVWIDPYFSTGAARRYPPLLSPDEVTAADIVLVTHEHLDHLDPHTLAGIAAHCPKTVFVAPAFCRDAMLAAGVRSEQLRTPRTGEPLRPGPHGLWEIVAVPCAHEQIDWDAARDHRYTGYVATADGVSCYHAGDTVACDELLAALLPWVGRLDLAMLPINGGDYFRRHDDIIGNFTFREAAELAVRLDAAVTVPMHYDLFQVVNDERPSRFVDYLYERAPYLPVAVMAPGQRLLVGGR